ncbi:MAG: hypothetical protein COB61_005820 [Thiotrichales bacterium]|nr:hypothetical protein [Thiotrichales bacterium]
MSNQLTISELKQRVDIVEYIGNKIQLKKNGANFSACCPFHDESTPSFQVSPSKQIATCFGGCTNGKGKAFDILDFIQKFHNVSNIEAINLLREYAGSPYQAYSTPQNYQAQKQETPKDKTAIQTKLNKTATALMHNHNKLTIFKLIPTEHENRTDLYVLIHELYHKLFEKKQFTMSMELKKRTNYMLKYILAYDSFFKCPAIIIRDHTGVVCDIAKYRPQKPDSFSSFSNPKYMYIKEEDKLKDRGDDFLYPFSKEMDRLIDKHNFFFIGEGLKNALVAFLFGVPFISLESVSNGISENLKDYIKEKSKNKTIIGAFDGDEKLNDDKSYSKGHGAYLKAKEVLGIEFNNLFKFDSNIDFADYLKDENNLIDFDKKFNDLFINMFKNETTT